MKKKTLTYCDQHFLSSEFSKWSNLTPESFHSEPARFSLSGCTSSVMEQSCE